MRKSREFENILDECLERLLVRGETIEQCLQRFPELANELKPLLETALAVNKASAIQPHPEFRDRARYQFYAALQATESKRSRPFFLWRLRWVTVIAILLALVLASGGTVAAASGSMPDEFLYPAKLATEQVQLVLTPSALGKAELYAKLADRRVVEIVRMADESKAEDDDSKSKHIERTARRLDVYLAKIAILFSIQEVTSGEAMVPASREAAVEEGEEEAVEEGEEEAVEEGEEEAVEEGEEAAVEEREEAAVKSAPRISERTRGHLERGIKSDRRAKLREMMGRSASNHPARLRALLKTVPPSARPALLRAIAISERGYKKALESLD